MAQKYDLRRKTAIVTGGASGIGLEFAKVLANMGANLILIDINEKRLEEAREILESSPNFGAEQKIEVSRVDLASEDALQWIDTFCKEKNLNPEILINNAGIFSFKPITDTDTRKIETFIDLHVRAVTLLSQWFVSRRKSERSGWMLNMSSMSCWMPMPGLAMYSSTKSYIRVFSRALHYEMRDHGVGVTVACPGGIATDLFGLPEKWKRFAVAIGVLQTPETFARKAVKKMLAGKKQYINGFLNRFSICFVGILPTGVRMMVKRQLLDKGITR